MCAVSDGLRSDVVGASGVEWVWAIARGTISPSVVANAFLVSSKAEATRLSNSSINCSLRDERADDSSSKDRPVRRDSRQSKQNDCVCTVCLF